MALTKCPKCEKEISDKAIKCPGCGYDLNQKNSEMVERVCEECGHRIEKDVKTCENCGCPVEVCEEECDTTGIENKPQKRFSKKCIISIVIALLAVAIGVTVYLVITANSRNYEKAIELYNTNQYSESLEIFQKISDYKDSSKYVENCKHELSVNGQFLRSFATGLEKRWELNVADENDNKATTSEQWKGFIDAEYNEIKKFSDKEFEDKELGEKAKKYIKLLEEAQGMVKYYGSNTSTFWNQYNPVYQERCVLIKDLNENHSIPISNENKSKLNDLIATGELTLSVRKIMENTKFEKTSNEYGWKKYEAIVENTSDTTFVYFNFHINLISKDGTVVETPIASTDNWKPKSKNRFTFSTDEEFEKIEISSCDYS